MGAMERSNRQMGLRSLMLCVPVLAALVVIQTMLQSCHTNGLGQGGFTGGSRSRSTGAHPITLPAGARETALSGSIHTKARLTREEVNRTIGHSRMLSPIVPYLMTVLGKDMAFRADYSITGPQDDLMVLANPRLTGFKGVDLTLPARWQQHLKLPRGARLTAKTRWMVTRWTKAEDVIHGRDTIRHRGYYYEVVGLIDVNIGNAFFYTFITHGTGEKLGIRCKAPEGKSTPPKSDTFDDSEIKDPMPL